MNMMLYFQMYMNFLYLLIMHHLDHDYDDGDHYGDHDDVHGYDHDAHDNHGHGHDDGHIIIDNHWHEDQLIKVQYHC